MNPVTTMSGNSSVRTPFPSQLLYILMVSQEFQRAVSAPQPTYTDYQAGTRWSCLMEIEGHDQPFGSLDNIFGSKKAARQHAAGCAVAHFKALGQWPEDVTQAGGIRKRKPAPPTSPSASVGGEGVGAAQQVAILAVQLSLGTPEYRFTPSTPGIPDVHTVSCFFKDGGVHAGPIGEVRNVFGKKKAKEECARLTLSYLSDLKRQREAVAERLIRGIQGGDEVKSAAGGMAMDGEEGVAGKHADKVANQSDDEMEIFEDAMEH